MPLGWVQKQFLAGVEILMIGVGTVVNEHCGDRNQTNAKRSGGVRGQKANVDLSLPCWLAADINVLRRQHGAVTAVMIGNDFDGTKPPCGASASTIISAPLAPPQRLQRSRRLGTVAGVRVVSA